MAEFSQGVVRYCFKCGKAYMTRQDAEFGQPGWDLCKICRYEREQEEKAKNG